MVSTTYCSLFLCNALGHSAKSIRRDKTIDSSDILKTAFKILKSSYSFKSINIFVERSKLIFMIERCKGLIYFL